MGCKSASEFKLYECCHSDSQLVRTEEIMPCALLRGTLYILEPVSTVKLFFSDYIIAV